MELVQNGVPKSNFCCVPILDIETGPEMVAEEENEDEREKKGKEVNPEKEEKQDHPETEHKEKQPDIQDHSEIEDKQKDQNI